MANTIRIKRSSVSGKAPVVGDLQLGELAVNTFDGKLYTKKDNGTASIVEIGASGVSDGDKGDITVSSSGTVWTLDATAVTAGSYTLAGFTVDAKGRLTAASSGSTTGSGNVVLATSPTLVTPLLGTPTSGTLTNCTGYTFANIASKPTTLSGYGITDAATSTHTHGNISNAGAIGTTANLPIITTTSGVLTTGSFGSTANTFCQGNDSRLSDTRNTSNSVTFNNGGLGGASGSTFNGSSALTVSYNTIGAPSTTGTNASGSWGISITGSAATLTTARTINGTSFNGSANITTSSWGTSRTVTVGNTGKAVDGSAAVSWTLAEIGALPTAGGTLTGNLDNTGTGYMQVSVGTTAQRPAVPAAGMIRFNTSRSCFEGYTGSVWVNMSPLQVDDVGATA